MEQGKAKIEEKTGEAQRLWFVLSTQWRQEKLALENLTRQGFEAYLPMRQEEIKPRGQPARVIALPLFPRYLFVSVDQAANGWRAIYSTRGVQGVLPSTSSASRVLGRLISDLQAKEERGFVQLVPGAMPCRFRPGDKVSYGAFLDAVFHERVDDRRCVILVSILGLSDSAQIVDLAHLE